MQTIPLLKFWQWLQLLMCLMNCTVNCTMICTMNFTMNYNIAPFSHTFNVQNIWFGKRSKSLRASDKPNLISTNERGDNIRPMRRGDYFTIFGSCLRPAVYLRSFSFPFHPWKPG